MTDHGAAQRPQIGFAAGDQLQHRWETKTSGLTEEVSATGLLYNNVDNRSRAIHVLPSYSQWIWRRAR